LKDIEQTYLMSMYYIIQTSWSQSLNTSASPVQTQRIKLRCLFSLWDGSSQPCWHILWE